MTNVFAVVGEHRDEPTRLLLIGEDGRYYACEADALAPTEVEPSDEWNIDAAAPEEPRHGPEALFTF